ncbi:MAG: ABC transporter substrate-binding protein [Proteobacteria bacterium]|nr:ABC transporter substrate-binding protein [Pseudomonadota bacterium]
MTAIKIVSRTQGNNAALKNGSVTADGFELQFEEVPVLAQAFRRMVRELEFDVCEMALTTYLCAREHGVKFTALPIFPVRAFHHGAILHNIKSDTRDPADLQGKRVGVNRGYTVTTGVWARSILQDEYGVDLSKITWVLSGDEHVEAYVPPPNVESVPAGQTIEELLLEGDLAAAIGLSPDSSHIQPLIADPLDAGFDAFKNRGHYPINHLIVVRNEVLDAHPGIAVAVFDAFTESKNRYLEQLQNGEITNPDSTDNLHARMLESDTDPLPYGIAPNRGVLEDLIAHATTQKIITQPIDVESVFAPATRQLTG